MIAPELKYIDLASRVLSFIIGVSLFFVSAWLVGAENVSAKILALGFLLRSLFRSELDSRRIVIQVLTIACCVFLSLSVFYNYNYPAHGLFKSFLLAASVLLICELVVIVGFIFSFNKR